MAPSGFEGVTPPKAPLARPEAVRVSLLDGFRVAVGPKTIEEGRWRLQKAASLVKLLALAPGHRLHREQIIELLWPKLEPKAAANNLHQALHVARRTLEPEAAVAPSYLHLRAELLELCPNSVLWVDVEAFEEAAEMARRSHEPGAYRAAVELYAGDLLPDDRYDEWAEERREALRFLYLSVLVEMARLHEERGDVGEAIKALQEVAATEPTHEGAQASLMRLYALSGQRYLALRQYKWLVQTLGRELDAEPEAESRRLYEELSAILPVEAMTNVDIGHMAATGCIIDLPIRPGDRNLKDFLGPRSDSGYAWPYEEFVSSDVGEQLHTLWESGLSTTPLTSVGRLVGIYVLDEATGVRTVIDWKD